MFSAETSSNAHWITFAMMSWPHTMPTMYTIRTLIHIIRSNDPYNSKVCNKDLGFLIDIYRGLFFQLLYILKAYTRFGSKISRRAVALGSNRRSGLCSHSFFRLEIFHVKLVCVYVLFKDYVLYHKLYMLMSSYVYATNWTKFNSLLCYCTEGS